MGLRCLIGHDFAPPETEREREERGDEVVVTVRELKECTRCGERRIITENKEVRTTSRSTSEEAADAETGRHSAEHDPAAAPTTESTYDEVSAEEDDGVILPNEPEERGEGEWPESKETDEPDESADEPSQWPDAGESPETPGETEAAEWPDTEEASAESADSEPSAWPARDSEKDEEDESASEPQPWPETTGEDEGFDAVTGGDDSDVDDVEFGGGLTPQRSGGSTPDDTDESDDATEVAPAGITSTTPGPEPTGPQLSNASGDSLLVCPECGNEVSGEITSHRPGDICPECRRGYLTARERE